MSFRGASRRGSGDGLARLALATTLCAIALAESAGAATELGDVFQGLDATFVLYDRTSGRLRRYDAERAAVRFSPCSTFKIPNSLIALESGVVDGADTSKAWNEKKHPCDLERQGKERCDTLSRDHTLRSALKNSVVWYYQEIATEVGEPAMQRYVDVFDYGNRDLTGGVDRFWLSSSLLISADEQIAFLRRFYDGKLGSARNTEVVKDILVVEETETYRLSAKTGMGLTPQGRPLGWWVGYVERGDRVYFFALNVEADTWDVIRENRVPKARQALAALGLLE